MIKEAIKRIFRQFDANGDGTLRLQDLTLLLKKLEPSYSDAHIGALFDHMDQDLSGAIDFCEFVDFVHGDTKVEKLFKLEAEAKEEEAKEELLCKPVDVREAASKAAKARGLAWTKMSWQERLEEAKQLEKGKREADERRKNSAPVRSDNSTYSASEKKRRKASAEPERPQTPANVKGNEAVFAKSAQLVTAFPPSIGVDKFTISKMSQSELVAYSLQSDDLDFVSGDAAARAELRGFRDHVATASGPLPKVNVERFLAKGTAGWVFLVEDKESGEKRAMKLIRMTQARTGIREWYVSKRLKALGISKVVFTDEDVYVMPKGNATQIIQDALAHAGPVPFFMATMQELMPWGSLEDLANEGELSLDIMFEIFDDIAGTLASMHENNIQHRDIKPENIMLVMEDEQITSAKLCDFGRATIGESPEGRADDIRRFGVTVFSVLTGEGWLTNRLIHEKHADLVERLTDAVKDMSDPLMARLPGLLQQILGGELSMREIAGLMRELADSSRSSA